MKTDLEIAQDQLELALKEIKSIKGRNVELLHDYVFEAHRLVKKLTIPDIVKRSKHFTCSCGIPPAIRLCEGVQTCLECGDKLSK